MSINFGSILYIQKRIKNKCLDVLGSHEYRHYPFKGAKRRPKNFAILESLLHANEGRDEALEKRLQMLNRHIKALNTLERGIMLLLLEGNSYQEIADVIGLSSSNVGTRISRIKQKLRENMTKSSPSWNKGITGHLGGNEPKTGKAKKINERNHFKNDTEQLFK